MPDYETHLLYGSMIGILMGAYTVAFQPPHIAANDGLGIGLFVFAMFCVGAVLPDIDNPPSKPRRLLPWGVLLVTGGITYLFYIVSVSGGFPATEGQNLIGGFLALLVGGISAMKIPPMVDELTVHRRFLHMPFLYLLPFWIPGKALQEQVVTIPGIHSGLEVYIIGPGLIALFWGTVLHCVLDGVDFVSKTIQRYRSHPSLY